MSERLAKKYAVIELAGQQHLVWPGARVISGKLVDKEGELIVRKSMLDRSPVELKIIAHGSAKKIRGLKFKAKTRYMRRYGHRQPQSIVEVVSIGGIKKDKIEVSQSSLAKAPSKKVIARKTGNVKKTVRK